MARIVGLIIAREEPERFVCPHCGKEYKTAQALKNHVQKSHRKVSDDPEQEA